jgi:hypothetical protein
MTNVTAIAPALSIRQQAEEEVRKEQGARALSLMKSKLRDLASAQTIVKSIELQIVDLERQIADGTL